MDERPQVIKYTGLAVQICVPMCWSDEKIADWMQSQEPHAVATTWEISDEPPRSVDCNDRPNYKHLVLN